MGTPVSGGLVKNAGAIGWSDVDTAEAALIERCTTGDETACADLVNTHQRMVYRKLGADGRRDAVRRAKQLRLL